MISANLVQTGFNFSGVDGKSGMSAVSGSKDNVKSVKSDFSSYMDGSGADCDNTASKAAADLKPEDSDATSFTDDKANVMYPLNSKDLQDEPEVDKMCSEAGMSLMSESAAQVVQQVMEVIKADTGCTDEQLQTVLDNLNLEPSQLLSPEVLKNVVMELNGVDDSSVMLVDQDLYQMYTDVVKDVMAITEDFAQTYEFPLQQETNMADTVKQLLSAEKIDTNEFTRLTPDIPDEGKTAAEQEVKAVEIPQDKQAAYMLTENGTVNANLPEEDNIVKDAVEKQEMASVDDIVMEPETASVDEGAEPVIEVNKEVLSETTDYAKTWEPQDNNADDNQQKVSEENPQVIPVTEEESAALKNSNEYLNQKGQSTENFHDGGHKAEKSHVSADHTGNTDFETITSNLFEHIKETVSAVNPHEAENTSFTTRIFNQLMDGLKVMAKEDMTSMEMQLYPENLGRLNIQVLAKNGIITAQIITQSEAVKEAIESQMFLFKENLGNQEIRIEDVEVTVSSHAFEQEMDNGGRNDSDQQQKKRRFVSDDDSQVVSLSDIKAIKEEILEEAIREQKGSTVSYTA